ncbi:MAG: Holliday junction resolvase RuvX [Flavobacteriales bacterium TMED191]|nr:MAG: Holliday junction resolvase RuvX [Flavobacteriales bacterium TMED191]|tara:strand:- start:4506 stop:4925 length:420 start_codon:yes stop_codon:yes gene_type:complete
MGRILAIDYGLKRIGLAQTDEMKLIASPLDTVSSKDIFKYLHSYFQNENIESIVIGDPKTLDNKPAIITKKILVFKDKLKKMCDKPIYFIDERFTSRIALKSLVDMNTTKRQRRDKSLVDKISATLILQSYLYREKNIL